MQALAQTRTPEIGRIAGGAAFWKPQSERIAISERSPAQQDAGRNGAAEAAPVCILPHLVAAYRQLTASRSHNR